MKRIALLIVLLVGVYAWYNWIWNYKGEETEFLSPSEEAPSFEEEQKPDQDRNPQEPDKLDLTAPRIKDVTGRKGLKPPNEVIQKAGRFHWLIHLSGPEIETETVLQEIDGISRPEITQTLREMEYEPGQGKQVWGIILVGAISEENDIWTVNTVAQVDGKPTSLYLKLKKGGDGEWIVWDLLESLS